MRRGEVISQTRDKYKYVSVSAKGLAAMCSVFNDGYKLFSEHEKKHKD